MGLSDEACFQKNRICRREERALWCHKLHGLVRRLYARGGFEMSTDKLLLVDGTNVALRFAAAMLGTLEAEKLDAAQVHPVLTSIERAIRQCAGVAGCRRCAVIFDASGHSWRRERFDGYKTNRAHIPFPWSERASVFLEDGGWHTIAIPGVEADDVIATLTTQENAHGRPVAVLSADCDLLQLVGPLCSVYQFGKRGEDRFILRTTEWICDKYGVASVGQLAYWKALVGDSSDNLPGVHGIGPVKARTLIGLFPSPDDLIAGCVLKRSQREQFSLMLDLVTLRIDAIPLDSLGDCRIPFLP